MNNYFGKYLRNLRRSSLLTQVDLAKRAGLDRSYLSMLERGLRNPSLETVFKLCRVLEIDPGHFVGELNSLIKKDDPMPMGILRIHQN